MIKAIEAKGVYCFQEEIGRGRYGIVYKCTNSFTKDVVALKAINKSTLTDSLDSLCLRSEPKILRHLPTHPFIVHFHDHFESDAHLFIITDLCSGGDLHSLISSFGPLSEPNAKPIFIQIMQAISHCHAFGVVHRDIKAENILIDCNGNAKLADFGSAEIVCAGGGALHGLVGTPMYVAPEILQGSGYNEKVDIWSAGVLLYVMLAGYYPFRGDDAVEIFESVMRGNVRFPTRSFAMVSPTLKDLLRKMLCKDPLRRLSADQVLEHSWMSRG